MKNHIKKSLKASNGITLIALVVTIIVLLILAGISISMLSGDNGILQKATDAKTKSDEAQIKERIQLAYHSAIAGGKGSYTKESLEAELIKEFGASKVDDNTIDTSVVGIWTVTIDGVSEEVYAGSSVPTVLKIGDVVEATGLAKFKDSENQDIEWIYFGKDDSGNNLVTTAKPVKETFTMNEQPDSSKIIENSAKNWLYYDLQDTDTGYTDAECTETNNINKFCAKLYSDNGGTVGKARSITLEDINRVTGYTEPTFTPITFGTGTGEYNYYYPTIDAKNQNTNTSASPKVYKYWKKATGESEKTFTATEIHLEYYYDSSTYTSENMKYVIGESNDYLYAVGSRSVYGIFHRCWLQCGLCGLWLCVLERQSLLLFVHGLCLCRGQRTYPSSSYSFSRI